MRTILLCSMLAIAVQASLPDLQAAKMTEWTDANGKAFKGEPAGIVGPYAVFRTGKRSTLSVRLRSMPAADCVRFWETTRAVPARADHWADAASVLSAEFRSHLHQLKDGKIEKVDVGGRPEPELFLLIFGWHDHGESWESFGAISTAYHRLRGLYPDAFEAVFLGVKHDAAKNRRIITEAQMPWLVTLMEDHRNLRTALQYQPGDPPMIAVVTRHGDFITGSGKFTKDSIEKGLMGFETLLVQMKPNSPRSTADLKHYLAAIQPVAFRTGRSEPVLIASPLDEAALRGSGLKRVDATFLIGADHTVKEVEVSDNGGILSGETTAALAAALRQAVFVAAVENGSFVDAPYEIHLNLAH